MAEVTKENPVTTTIAENKSTTDKTVKPPALLDANNLEEPKNAEELKENEPKQKGEDTSVRKKTILEQHGLYTGRQIGCGSYAKVRVLKLTNRFIHVPQ
jgi:hypothetical protein